MVFGMETRDFTKSKSPANKVLIKVLASSVNMSDVKMRAGLMPFVKPPIVSGRDYSVLLNLVHQIL